MSVKLNAGQIRLLFDQWGDELCLNYGDNFKSIAEGLLAQKKQQYSGNDYLNQIEKNVIYLSEGRRSLNLAIAQYLVQGNPILNSDEIPNFVEFTRIQYPQTTMPFHWEYVKNGCKGCPVHSEHSRYKGIRKLRLAGDWSKYLDELEFSYKYYQVAYILGQNYLGMFLQNQDLADSASFISLQEIEEVVDQRVRIWTDTCIGNLRFLIEGRPAEEWLAQQVNENPSLTASAEKQKNNKKPWWKFW